jgi:spore coat protein U-like protein
VSQATSTRARAPARLVGVALAVIAPPAAYAAVSCSVTATGVAFGIYTPLQTGALAANGTIAISCTGVLYDVATVSLSTGLSGTYTNRTLQNGAAALDYNLYTSANGSQIWGNGTGGTGTGQAVLWFFAPTANLTVYGAVNAAQDPAPGTYMDTITVSVAY